jgi:hypothetical protein
MMIKARRAPCCTAGLSLSLLKIPSGHGIGIPMKTMVADVR